MHSDKGAQGYTRTYKNYIKLPNNDISVNKHRRPYTLATW